MFALTRNLAKDCDVREFDAEVAVLQRHMLASLAGRLGLAVCKADVVRATVAWANLERELPHIVSALRSAGARVATLKGASYVTAIYATPSDRPMTDVDLLVPRAEFRRAADVLGQLGFQRFPDPAMHHAETWARGALVIDLHDQILGEGRSRVDLGALWSRARPGAFGAERLESHDELAFHLLHMARNRLCGPLIQVVDAIRLADRCDVEVAVERATSWGVGHAARVAWKFVCNVLADREPRGLLEPRLEDVIEVRQPNDARKLVFDIATAGSPRQLAARMLATVKTRLS